MKLGLLKNIVALLCSVGIFIVMIAMLPLLVDAIPGLQMQAANFTKGQEQTFYGQIIPHPDNAVDYTIVGTNIRILSKRPYLAGRWVSLTVSYTGLGDAFVIKEWKFHRQEQLMSSTDNNTWTAFPPDFSFAGQVTVSDDNTVKYRIKTNDETYVYLSLSDELAKQLVGEDVAFSVTITKR